MTTSTINIGPVIKPKTGHNRYCGPAALSIILRIDTAEAAEMLRKASGRRAIKGVYTNWMRRALESRGYRVQDVTPSPTTTLAQWLKANPLTKRGTNVYLIASSTHYVTVQGRRGGCNQTKGIVPLKDIKKRRGVVKSIFLVSPPSVEAKAKIARVAKLQPFKTVENALAAYAKAQEDLKLAQQRVLDLAKRVQLTRVAVAKQGVLDARSQRAKLRREATKLGIRIERDMGDWWVFGPVAVYGDNDEGPEKGLREDPCGGSHFCTSAEEVDETIGHYVRDLALAKQQGVA